MAERNLADELERFVKEQAGLYGEVISYVPAKPAVAKSAPKSVAQSSTALAVSAPQITASKDTERMPADAASGSATAQSSTIEETDEMPKRAPITVPGEIAITHHGFGELKDKLAPYRDEKWTAVRSLPVLHELIQDCQKCPLWKDRTKFVFGVGNPQARVLVIGEAPGADEDQQGEPFVGRAGQLLNKMLSAIEFERSEVYIANILKSRPPNNREPKPDEVEACEPYLWKQILLIKPTMILCMGRVAGTNLLKLKEPLAKMRGNVYDFYGMKVMVTYHPAALLRNPDWKHGAWEDLKKFRRLYDEIFSADLEG